MPPNPPALTPAAPPAPLVGPSSPQPTAPPIRPAAGQSEPTSKTSRAFELRRSLGTGRSYHIPHGPSPARTSQLAQRSSHAWRGCPTLPLPRGANQGIIGSPAAPPAP